MRRESNKAAFAAHGHSLACLIVAVTLTACSSSAERSVSDSGTPSFTSRFAQLFGSSSSSDAQTTASAAATDTGQSIECPPVDVRAGTATLAINANTREPNPQALRYQGTINQMARECRVLGGNLTIKVGVQGRLILGPAGTAGQVDIPLRYALVREGPEPKTLWTKLARLPVTIGDDQSGVTFTHVEEEMSVPKPVGDELDAYVIYVGFDPLGVTNEKKKQAPARRR